VEYIGIDGAKGGWIAAVLDGDGARPHFYLLDSIGPALTMAESGQALVAIDIPLGLPDKVSRPCDGAARVFLKARASSVFSAPCRAALRHVKDYQAACDVNERHLGVRLSKQSHALFGRMRHANGLLRPELHARVFEAHPEVTFAVLANGGLRYGKKDSAGVTERLAILRGVGVVFDPARERAWLAGGVAENDLLDAAACAVTARRIGQGTARRFPAAEVQTDQADWPTAITA
jgi:predicted RNase H-like nuclease